MLGEWTTSLFSATEKRRTTSNWVSFISLSLSGDRLADCQAETILLRDQRIKHIVVFGKGKPQNGVLVDPAPGTQGPRSFIDEIWPTIVAMNKEVPMHSRLVRELVLVANPGRPFALTDKGTVRGKITLALYEKEIEDAYSHLEDSTSSKWELPVTFDVESIQTFLVTVIEEVLGREVNNSDDLFAQG